MSYEEFIIGTKIFTRILSISVTPFQRMKAILQVPDDSLKRHIHIPSLCHHKGLRLSYLSLSYTDPQIRRQPRYRRNRLCVFVPGIIILRHELARSVENNKMNFVDFFCLFEQYIQLVFGIRRQLFIKSLITQYDINSVIKSGKHLFSILPSL